jgi:large subunit ribosomal protein L32
MAVPRNRLSNSRKNTKRSHHAKKPINTHTCANCAKPKLRHSICLGCGAYGSRIVIAESA